MFLEKSHQLGDEVITAFSGGVHDTLAAGLRGVLLALPVMEERVRGCITPQDLIKLLPSPECFLRCLRKARSAFCCHAFGLSPCSHLILPKCSPWPPTRNLLPHSNRFAFKPSRDQTWEF